LNERAVIDKAKLLAALEPKITAALMEMGEAETRTIYYSLSIPVTRDFAGRVSQRSQPGEAPRVDEDILRQNISYDVQQQEDGFTLYIRASRPPQESNDQFNAASILEFGGMNQQGSYVAPRPFMYPALMRMSGYFQETVDKHL
jgi:hypothetical protein